MASSESTTAAEQLLKCQETLITVLGRLELQDKEIAALKEGKGKVVEQAQEIALLKEVKGKVVEQAGRIEELKGEVSRLKESNVESKAVRIPVQRPSGDVPVQTGDFAWIWRGVLIAGGLLQPGLTLAGVLKGDIQLRVVGYVFQTFTWTCIVA